MNRFDSINKPLLWVMAVLLTVFVAACGGSGNPILGGGGAGVIAGAPQGSIIPGGVCTAAAGPTIPKVDSSVPLSGAQSVSIGIGAKAVTATFSLAMDPLTINSATIGALSTFTLKDMTTSTGTIVPATVAMDVTNTLATLTTSSPLTANTSYTAVITTAAQSATAVPLGCTYAWNFKTAAVVPVPFPNMGAAATYGIAATAGITNTNVLPLTTINGDVVLDSTLTCNGTAVPGGVGSAGFGLCNSTAPTSVPVLNGTVYITGDVPTAGVIADMKAAYLQITPPAGPPAAGSLSGATNLPAGTTLGAATGSALVLNDNLFYAGVYQSLTSIMITGDLTLDAQGNPDAVFIFQSSSSVGTADGAAPPGGTRSRILLVNGAKASNVWWQAGTSATLGLYSEFQGNILASESITMNTGATSCGRLMAGAFAAGAFVFDANVVSVPGQPFAPPATYSTVCQ